MTRYLMVKAPTQAAFLLTPIMVRMSSAPVFIRPVGEQMWSLAARVKGHAPLKRMTARLNDACRRLGRYFPGTEPPEVVDLEEQEGIFKGLKGDRRFFRPHCLPGELWIVPAGWGGDLPKGATRIELEIGRACGTGLHPTTQCCLRLLRGLSVAGLPSPILDVGTGTGIMALAAVLWGAQRVVAIDINPHATAIARKNARRNMLKDRMEVHCRDVIKEGGRYPLVLANLSSNAVRKRAEAIVRCVSAGGRLILGGIWRSKRDDYLKLFCPPMRLLCVQCQAWWCSALLQR